MDKKIELVSKDLVNKDNPNVLIYSNIAYSIIDYIKQDFNNLIIANGKYTVKDISTYVDKEQDTPYNGKCSLIVALLDINNLEIYLVVNITQSSIENLSNIKEHTIHLSMSYSKTLNVIAGSSYTQYVTPTMDKEELLIALKNNLKIWFKEIY